MRPSEIRWNEPARQKILDDSDRVLRDAVVELAQTMQGKSSDEVYEELFARMQGRFIDFQPGPDIRTYADAVADGSVEVEG